MSPTLLTQRVCEHPPTPSSIYQIIIVSFEIQCAAVQRQSNGEHVIVLTLFALYVCPLTGCANNVKIDNLALPIAVFVYMLLEHHVYFKSPDVSLMACLK